MDLYTQNLTICHACEDGAKHHRSGPCLCKRDGRNIAAHAEAADCEKFTPEGIALEKRRELMAIRLRVRLRVLPDEALVMARLAACGDCSAFRGAWREPNEAACAHCTCQTGSWSENLAKQAEPGKPSFCKLEKWPVLGFTPPCSIPE